MASPLPAFPRPSSLLLVLLLALPLCAQGRVIVLGFDGADERTARLLMERGDMPNFKRLAETGTFAPLGTTTPDESPTAWASLNSGQNPAKTGIPGFMKREMGRFAPLPAAGYVVHGSRSIDDMDLPLFWRFLGQKPALVAVECGVVCALVFFAFFAALLRMKRGFSGFLAFVLGCVGAWAGQRAASDVPPVIDDVLGNPCQVGGFWEVAARAGVPSMVIDGAMTWDRPRVDGARVLSGLGVPDARTANCDWFVYTTKPEYEYARAPTYKGTSTAGEIFHLEPRNGRLESFVYGPIDLTRAGHLLAEKRALDAKVAAGDAIDADLDRLDQVRDGLNALHPTDGNEEGRLALPLAVEVKDGKAELTIGTETHEIAPGEWSKWFSLTFEVNALIKVRAITRARLVSIDDPLEIFLDSLQIDPAAPPFWQPISQPPGFAGELAKEAGKFDTVGWGCLTMPFKDSKIDTTTFVQDIEFTHDCRVKLLSAAIKRDDWRVLMNVEATPDRMQHMLYQYYDTEHPKYDATAAATRVRFNGKDLPYSELIPESYRQMDALVGQVLDHGLKSGDTLLVCSDHGFQSFRRQFHLNNWLAENGYLVMRQGVTGADWDFLSYVDWAKTKAYSLGLGGIYVNEKGREPGGIVEPDAVDALLEEMTAKLLATEDTPVAGGPSVRAVHNVLRTDRIHSGPHLDLEADLMPGLSAGWRVSWKSTRGGIQLKPSADKESWVTASAFEDNMNNWSGDHVSVADELVRGIFLCNRKVDAPVDGFNLLDIAPTALTLVGVPVPAEYDHPALHFSDGR